jgi:hypothetical protein
MSRFASCTLYKEFIISSQPKWKNGPLGLSGSTDFACTNSTIQDLHQRVVVIRWSIGSFLSLCVYCSFNEKTELLYTFYSYREELMPHFEVLLQHLHRMTTKNNEKLQASLSCQDRGLNTALPVYDKLYSLTQLAQVICVCVCMCRIF